MNPLIANMSPEEILKQKFRVFKRICQDEPSVFSLDQAAEMVESDFNTLKNFSFSTDKRQVEIHQCRYYCALNVVRANDNGELTEKEADQHLRNLGLLLKWTPFGFGDDSDNLTAFEELQLRVKEKDARAKAALDRREQYLKQNKKL